MDVFNSIRHELRVANALVNNMFECRCYRDDCLFALSGYFSYLRKEVQGAIYSAIEAPEFDWSELPTGVWLRCEIDDLLTKLEVLLDRKVWD